PGPHRRRARPVQAARPQLPRLRQVAQAAGLGRGERPPRRYRLPPGEPVAPPRPLAPLGRGQGGGRWRRRSEPPAGPPIPGAVGRGVEGPERGRNAMTPTRREALAAAAALLP